MFITKINRIFDAIKNNDVVNFVESYRNTCKKNVKASVQGHLINPSNSCIAQMLCEEARVRWFSIVKEEGVNIDDISCIILELKNTPNHIKSKVSITGKINDSETINMIREASQFKNGLAIDPRRGSLISP